MVYMSFRLEMDRPIIRGTHYISPGGYRLRFWFGNGNSREIEFDFENFSGNIVDGKYLDCTVSSLDTYAFEESASLLHYLKNCNYDWLEFFVYTGENDEAEINPVKAFNIVIGDGSLVFSMKDYVFVDDMKHKLSDQQFDIIMNIMERPLKFCKSNQILSKGGEIRFYEQNGKIFLCSAAGYGYYYNVSRGNAGCIRCNGSVDAAKGLMMDVVSKLTRLIPFPVKSISMPCNTVIKSGYYVESTEEQGSYDIVLE